MSSPRDQEQRRAAARKRLIELAEASKGRMGDWRPSREETYGGLVREPGKETT
jgi:hypothetical protein